MNARDLRVRPGVAITAERWNRMIDAIESASKISVQSPLELITGKSGTTIRVRPGKGGGVARGWVTSPCKRGSREKVEKGTFEIYKYNSSSEKMESTGTKSDFFDDGMISLAIGNASGYIQCLEIDGSWWYDTMICPADEYYGE